MCCQETSLMEKASHRTKWLWAACIIETAVWNGDALSVKGQLLVHVTKYWNWLLFTALLRNSTWLSDGGSGSVMCSFDDINPGSTVHTQYIHISRCLLYFCLIRQTSSQLSIHFPTPLSRCKWKSNTLSMESNYEAEDPVKMFCHVHTGGRPIVVLHPTLYR